MKNQTLGQKRPVGTINVSNASANVQIKSHLTTPEGTIMKGLFDFAFSIPDFRRIGKGNIRHKLGDIIILMILARMSKCVARADIIEFGKHNLNKFQSLGLLKKGVPSEPTLCRKKRSDKVKGLAELMRNVSMSFTRLMHFLRQK